MWIKISRYWADTGYNFLDDTIILGNNIVSMFNLDENPIEAMVEVLGHEIIHRAIYFLADPKSKEECDFFFDATCKFDNLFRFKLDLSERGED